jgi:hypothetical protein
MAFSILGSDSGYSRFPRQALGKLPFLAKTKTTGIAGTTDFRVKITNVSEFLVPIFPNASLIQSGEWHGV